MVVLLAKAAPVGVILRRGPTRWWHVTLWDTKRDAFESGQWFHGRIYPEKCDVSPDGKLWIYFAAKFSLRSADKGYQDSWTAVSRPPYLTALTLWPIGGTYGGNGLFIDSGTVMVGSTEPSNHPDHPPGPLRVMAWTEARPVVPSLDFGWQGGRDVRKPSGDLILGREWPIGHYYPSRTATPYALYRHDAEPIATFEAHWADWDQQGRLVATVGGRVLSGKLTRDKRLVWRQLTDLHEEKPTTLEAPDWAQQWTPSLRRRRRRHKPVADAPHSK
jgi:hypothetical protein